MPIECPISSQLLSKIDIAPSGMNAVGETMYVINIERFVGHTMVGNAFMYAWVKGTVIEFPTMLPMLSEESVLITNKLLHYAD